MAIVIGLLVLIFLAIVAPRFLGAVFGIGVLFVVGAILADGNPHPIIWSAVGILVAWSVLKGMAQAYVEHKNDKR